MSIRALAVAQFAWLILVSGSHAQSAPQSDEFRKKVIDGWVALYQQDLQFDEIRTVCRKDNNLVFEMSIFRSRDSKLMEVHDDKIENCIGVNSKYMFYVTRDPGTQAPWKLLNVGTEPFDRIGELLQIMFFSPSSAFLPASSSNLHLSPEDALRSNDLKLWPKPNVADTAEFTYKDRRGELQLDPSNHYAITKLSSFPVDHSSNTGTFAFERDYQNGLARRMRTEINRPNQPVKLHSYEFEYVPGRKPNSLPESRFSLSHYGLPEPEGVVWDKPKKHLVFWLAGGGILLIVFAALVMRRLRHAKRAENPA